MKVRTGLLAPLLSWIVTTSPAAYAATSFSGPSRIVLGAAIDPPLGFMTMCVERPELCPAETAAAPPEPLPEQFPEQLIAWPTLFSALVAPIPIIPAIEVDIPVVAELAPDETAAAAPVAPPHTSLPRAADMKLLRRINRFVNRGVRQFSDWQTTGRDEVWQRSGVGRGAVGDCEDIALEKRAQLTQAGFPADQLSLAVVYSRKSGLHTVLVATAGDVDIVLDSRKTAVLPWKRARYRWIAMQAHPNAREWREVLSS